MTDATKKWCCEWHEAGGLGGPCANAKTVLPVLLREYVDCCKAPPILLKVREALGEQAGDGVSLIDHALRARKAIAAVVAAVRKWDSTDPMSAAEFSAAIKVAVEPWL